MSTSMAAIVAAFVALLSGVSAVDRTVFVHLFEWKWGEVASECENYLGPSGFSAVQISPPQKSINGTQWWTRYQPLSYAIEGRSGSREEFKDMVKRCNDVGVQIYADAVINHMSACCNRVYPEVPYTWWDFNDPCGGPIDYNSGWSIQHCDLEGLNDLKTSSEYVQNKIAEYMNDLVSLGVAGFRIDAAKHIDPGDVYKIISKINDIKPGQRPYVFQEVIGAEGEPVSVGSYAMHADVTEFKFCNTIGYYFKKRGLIKDLQNLGKWDDWLDSTRAVIFVSNHDNERKEPEKVLTNGDIRKLTDLASVFMLGWPYGYPKIMSGYEFKDHDEGPPTADATSCSGGWVCQHRHRAIANMVAFKNNCQKNFYVSHYWDNGFQQMAWGRGGLGFVVINREDDRDVNRDFDTGMEDGTYCDIIYADFDYETGQCNGPTIKVSGGKAKIFVGPLDSAAIHVGAKVGKACPTCGAKQKGKLN